MNTQLRDAALFCFVVVAFYADTEDPQTQVLMLVKSYFTQSVIFTTPIFHCISRSISLIILSDTS